MSALPAPKLYAVPTAPDITWEVEEGHPLLPDDTYAALCVGCDVKQVFRTLKTFLRFRISTGPHAGKVVFRAYGVDGKILPGKGPGSGPRPKIKRTSELYKMLCRVLSLPHNTAAHRVHSRELVGKLCTIKTRTVTKDHKQRPLGEAERYSVVDDVLSIEAG